MAVARVLSVNLIGVDAQVVEVEVDIATGLPAFILSALSDRVLNQLVHRVRSALTNSHEDWPNRKVTVALSPAAVPKSGSGFDLAVTIALLAADEKLPRERLDGVVFIGELGLSGHVRRVNGILPAVIGAYRAGVSRFVVPRANLREARLVPGAHVVGVSHLAELCAWLRGELTELDDDADDVADPAPQPVPPDFADVLGQPVARRMLEVAAAGGHHVYMSGPPGVGKTMLAERLPGLLPDLTEDEALEVTAIHSVLGRLTEGAGLMRRPPYAAPHHSASAAAVIGGGQRIAAPGLVSAAHRGVLFLDEAPEFSRSVLDALRQPLESGRISIARSGGVVTYPCRMLLVLAGNPCPCATGGREWQPSNCRCSSVTSRAYQSRLSGPLRDRIDLITELEPVSRQVLTSEATAESTAAIRPRVEAARDRSRHRLRGTPWTIGAEVPGPELRRHWPIADDVLRSALSRADLRLVSTRGLDRLLRVAWTIADLAGHDAPSADDVRESWSLRAGKDVMRPAAVGAA